LQTQVFFMLLSERDFLVWNTRTNVLFMLIVPSRKLKIAESFQFDFPDSNCICATVATEREWHFYYSKEIDEVDKVHRDRLLLKYSVLAFDS